MRSVPLLILVAGCASNPGLVDDPRFGSAAFATVPDAYAGDQTVVVFATGDACALGEALLTPNASPAATAEVINHEVGPDGWLLMLNVDASAVEAGGEIRLSEWGDGPADAAGTLLHQLQTLEESDLASGLTAGRAELFQSGNRGALTVDRLSNRSLVATLAAPFVGIDLERGEPTGAEESIDAAFEAAYCPEMVDALTAEPDLQPGPNLRDPSCEGADGTWCGCELVGAPFETDPDQVLGIGSGGVDPQFGTLYLGATARSADFCVQVDLLTPDGAHERHRIPYGEAVDWGAPEGVVHEYRISLQANGTFEAGVSTALPEGTDVDAYTRRVSVWSPEGGFVFCNLQGPEQSRMEGLPCGW